MCRGYGRFDNLFYFWTAVSGALAGVFAGVTVGLIMKKKKMGPRGVAMILITSSVIMCLAITADMFVACPQLQMAGVWQDNGELVTDFNYNHFTQAQI